MANLCASSKGADGVARALREAVLRCGKADSCIAQASPFKTATSMLLRSHGKYDLLFVLVALGGSSWTKLADDVCGSMLDQTPTTKGHLFR